MRLQHLPMKRPAQSCPKQKQGTWNCSGQWQSTANREETNRWGPWFLSSGSCVFIQVWGSFWGTRLHIGSLSFSHLSGSGPNKEIRTGWCRLHSHEPQDYNLRVVPACFLTELKFHLCRPNQEVEFSALESFQPNWSQINLTLKVQQKLCRACDRGAQEAGEGPLPSLALSRAQMANRPQAPWLTRLERTARHFWGPRMGGEHLCATTCPCSRWHGKGIKRPQLGTAQTLVP